MNLVLRREESELCAFIRLEGDFEIRDEKHYCEKESATETSKKMVMETVVVGGCRGRCGMKSHVGTWWRQESSTF